MMQDEEDEDDSDDEQSNLQYGASKIPISAPRWRLAMVPGEYFIPNWPGLALIFEDFE